MRPPAILAVGVLDDVGIAGTRGIAVAWQELGETAPGTGRTLRTVFGHGDQTYRRLDHQCRALVLAAQAAGIDDVLSPEQRHDAALITETWLGSIEADLRYTRLLREGLVDAAVFPYTLPSTCLGEVALRHGLRGPTICMSVEPPQTGEALWEARRLLAAGEARHAVVGCVDALGEAVPTLQPRLRAVVAVLAAAGEPGPAVAAWPAGEADPFAVLARACR